MPYSRGSALLVKQEIIDRLNAITLERTNLKVSMNEIEGFTLDTPVDTTGNNIDPGELNAKWDQVNTKATKALNK